MPAKRQPLRDAHAAYFASLDGHLEPNRLGPGERFDDRLLRIEADHPNYREALAHLAANGDAPGVLRLAGALAPFWNRGHLREGRQWLEWALERSPDDASLRRGIALAGLSLILWSQGDTERAAPAAERARAIGDAYGDAELLALAVHMLGMVEVTRGHWDKAERHMTEALAVQRAIGIPGLWGVGSRRPEHDRPPAWRRGHQRPPGRRGARDVPRDRITPRVLPWRSARWPDWRRKRATSGRRLRPTEEALGLWAGTGDRVDDCVGVQRTGGPGSRAGTSRSWRRRWSAWSTRVSKKAAPICGRATAVSTSGRLQLRGPRSARSASPSWCPPAGSSHWRPAVAAASAVAIPDPLVDSSSPSPAAPSASTLVTREQHAH